MTRYESVAAIAAMRARGLTYGQIKIKTGIERSTAFYLINPRPKIDHTDWARIHRKRARKEQMVVMMMEGLSQAKIAKAMGVTPMAVAHLFRRLRRALP